jgi:predicted site-specific integrase-resolvase
MTQFENNELCTDEAVARCLCVSVITLRRWRREGRGPKFIKEGRRVLYRRSAIAEWLAAREAGSTAEIYSRKRNELRLAGTAAAK